MRGRTAALIAASAVATAAMATPAMAAGPPPTPKATNGHTVQLVASGLNTPTSFAFGGGNVFEGDGGAETNKVPNGGVFVLKNGTGTLIPGSPQFVAGLAWHQSEMAAVEVERVERHHVHQPEGDLHGAKEVPGLQRHRLRSRRTAVRRRRHRPAGQQ
jgi:hypothetical protein